MMVSANSASCTPAEPTVAGPSARKNLRRFSSSPGLRNAGEHARARGIAHQQQNFENAGDQARPRPRRGPAVGNSAASASAAIIERLSRIGAAAAAAKCGIAFRMPP